MKRVYVVSFIVILLIMYASYMISYTITYNRYKDEVSSSSAFENESVEVRMLTEKKVDINTDFVYEILNTSTGELTYTEEKGPVKYLGYTKKMLEREIIDKSYPENVIKVELVSFDKDEVVMRKTIAYEISEEYYIKMINKILVIYLKDQETVYDYANINLDKVPDAVKMQIINGMYIENTEMLYEFLQNYSS